MFESSAPRWLPPEGDEAWFDAEFAALVAEGEPPDWACEDVPGPVETPREVLARLVQERPGPAVAVSLGAIAPEALAEDEAVTFLAVVARQQAWLESLSHRGTVAAAGLVPRVIGVPASAHRRSLHLEDPVREEIAALLGIAPVTAQSRIDLARVLHRLLPATCAALAAGTLAPMSARAIAETLTGNGLGLHLEIDDIDPAVAAAFEARVLPRALRLSVGQTRTLARRVFRALDPASAAARTRRERAARDVLVRHEPDGVSTLTARLATEDAHRIAGLVDTLAASEEFAESLDDPDVMRVGVRRAAALTALIEAGAGDATVPGNVRATLPRAVEVQLVMDLRTWLGLGTAPVEVVGGGVVPAEVARELAASGTVRRLLTDPVSGHLLDVGRRAYTAPDALRRFLNTRDRTCRAPGCSRRALACQVDHVVPWDQGGTTSRCNCHLLCVRHHQLKTHGGWKAATRHDGTVEWTTPQRRTHATSPPTPRRHPRYSSPRELPPSDPPERGRISDRVRPSRVPRGRRTPLQRRPR